MLKASNRQTSNLPVNLIVKRLDFGLDLPALQSSTKMELCYVLAIYSLVAMVAESLARFSSVPRA